MRILYCNKYNFGFSGTEAYLFETMELMRSRGHQVALFSMKDPRGQETAYDHNFVPHIDFKAPHSLPARMYLAARAIYSTKARSSIRGMIKEFQPAVAHVRNIYHHLSPSILWELRARKIPVVYHINDFKLICPSYNMVLPSGEACDRCQGGKFSHVVRMGCYSGGRAASVVLAAEAYLHRWLTTYETCVDLLLAPSLFVKEKLIANGWSSSRIEVLPHFQNTSLQASPHPGKNAPILYFGRLSPEKGLTHLLSAMEKLPHIELVIAGDGPHRPELEHQVRERRLQNVSFAGHLTRHALEGLVAQSQFTIFPSLSYETLGKSILESFAQRRAVVASDLGSRRELVQPGINGLLYPVRDTDQLAAAIAYLSDRPELSRQMGEAGCAMVRQRHSQKQHYLALEKIYDQLVSNAKPLQRLSPAPPRPLRVAFIGGRGIAGKYSGIETSYEQIGKRLAAKGHRVTAYCRTYFTPKGASHGGMQIVRLPTIRSKHLDTLVHTFLSTAHACFKNYDVVHYHTLGPSLFSFVPRMLSKKTVVTVQGLDWQRKKWSWIARSVLKIGEWASVRLPNKTVVVSRTLENHFKSRYAKQVSYMPNGADIREKKRGLYLERLGLAPDNYVLFLGRLSPEKNCELLIDAFEKTPTSMKLALAGGSSHTDDYVSNLRAHESERIKFLGWLSGDALDEVATNAALLVLPSAVEGLSLSLLEAMGSGVCVLVSDVPANREVVGDTGFLFRQGDVLDLRRMLTIVLSDGRLRAAAAQRARVRVRENYLWDDVAVKLEQLYLDLNPQSREIAVTQSPRARGKSA